MAQSSSSTTMWLKFFRGAGIPGGIDLNYALLFDENRMKMDMLMDLNKEYLKEMGIKAMGDIIAILKHAKTVNDDLKQQSVETTKVSQSTLPASTVSSVASRSGSSSSTSDTGVSTVSRTKSDLRPSSVASSVASTSRSTRVLSSVHSTVKAAPSKSLTPPQKNHVLEQEAAEKKIIVLKKRSNSNSPLREEVPFQKKTRVLPEHEGKYTIKMPDGTTPRTQKLVQSRLGPSVATAPKLVSDSSTDKKTVFARLGDSRVSSSEEDRRSSAPAKPETSSKSSSVFDRLGSRGSAAVSTQSNSLGIESRARRDEGGPSQRAYQEKTLTTIPSRLALSCLPIRDSVKSEIRSASSTSTTRIISSKSVSSIPSAVQQQKLLVGAEVLKSEDPRKLTPMMEVEVMEPTERVASKIVIPTEAPRSTNTTNSAPPHQSNSRSSSKEKQEKGTSKSLISHRKRSKSPMRKVTLTKIARSRSPPKSSTPRPRSSRSNSNDAGRRDCSGSHESDRRLKKVGVEEKKAKASSPLTKHRNSRARSRSPEKIRNVRTKEGSPRQACDPARVEFGPATTDTAKESLQTDSGCSVVQNSENRAVASSESCSMSIMWKTKGDIECRTTQLGSDVKSSSSPKKLDFVKVPVQEYNSEPKPVVRHWDSNDFDSSEDEQQERFNAKLQSERDLRLLPVTSVRKKRSSPSRRFSPDRRKSPVRKKKLRSRSRGSSVRRKSKSERRRSSSPKSRKTDTERSSRRKHESPAPTHKSSAFTSPRRRKTNSPVIRVPSKEILQRNDSKHHHSLPKKHAHRDKKKSSSGSPRAVLAGSRNSSQREELQKRSRSEKNSDRHKFGDSIAGGIKKEEQHSSKSRVLSSPHDRTLSGEERTISSYDLVTKGSGCPHNAADTPSARKSERSSLECSSSRLCLSKPVEAEKIILDRISGKRSAKVEAGLLEKVNTMENVKKESKAANSNLKSLMGKEKKTLLEPGYRITIKLPLKDLPEDSQPIENKNKEISSSAASKSSIAEKQLTKHPVDNDSVPLESLVLRSETATTQPVDVAKLKNTEGVMEEKYLKNTYLLVNDRFNPTLPVTHVQNNYYYESQNSADASTGLVFEVNQNVLGQNSNVRFPETNFGSDVALRSDVCERAGPAVSPAESSGRVIRSKRDADVVPSYEMSPMEERLPHYFPVPQRPLEPNASRILRDKHAAHQIHREVRIKSSYTSPGSVKISRVRLDDKPNSSAIRYAGTVENTDLSSFVYPNTNQSPFEYMTEDLSTKVPTYSGPVKFVKETNTVELNDLGEEIIRIKRPPSDSDGFVPDTKSIQMMEKMGWAPGVGLGKNNQGRRFPVESGSARPSGQGLGYGRRK